MDAKDPLLVRHRLGRWNAADLAFVEQLSLKLSPELETVLELVGLFQERSAASSSWPQQYPAGTRVGLRFVGVRDLGFPNFGTLPRQIMGLDIASVADCGLEGIAFNVGDYEAGAISFSCRDFEVEELQDQ